VGIANNVLELYGVRRFLADIDRDRNFCAYGEHIVSSCLDWIANEGFAEYFNEQVPEWKWETAHEYRQRYLLGTLKRAGMI